MILLLLFTVIGMVVNKRHHIFPFIAIINVSPLVVLCSRNMFSGVGWTETYSIYSGR